MDSLFDAIKNGVKLKPVNKNGSEAQNTSAKGNDEFMAALKKKLESIRQATAMSSSESSDSEQGEFSD